MTSVCGSCHGQKRRLPSFTRARMRCRQEPGWYWNIADWVYAKLSIYFCRSSSSYTFVSAGEDCVVRTNNCIHIMHFEGRFHSVIPSGTRVDPQNRDLCVAMLSVRRNGKAVRATADPWTNYQNKWLSDDNWVESNTYGTHWTFSCLVSRSPLYSAHSLFLFFLR
jgi:hypothetical protein